MLLARKWKTRKTIIALFCVELLLTIAALALFGIADPDNYRTALWTDGAENGFNSSPTEILYAYANYKPIKIPLVWSQLYVPPSYMPATRYANNYSITTYNVVISVLSMFILLVKSVMFVVHTFYPLLSVFVHALLVALYAYSVYAQSSSDMSDPAHPQKGAAWYITKNCKVAHDADNIGYCEQAKACFAIAIVML